MASGGTTYDSNDTEIKATDTNLDYEFTVIFEVELNLLSDVSN